MSTKLTRTTIQGLIERQRSAGQARLYAVGGGLGLWVSATGACSWRLRYRLAVDGRPVARMMALGAWPEVDLAEAQALAVEAKAQVRRGLDPVAQRRVARVELAATQAQRLQDLVDEWLEAKRPGWSESHYTRAKQAFKRDILPTLGRLPVADITPAMVALVIGKVAKRGAVETASRIRQHVAQVFDLARARGLRQDNPVVRDPTISRTTGRVKGRQPAILDLAELGGVLRAAEAADITPSVRLCLWILAHTAVRPGEAVPARWEEFQLTGPDPRWTIPRSRMKRQGTDRDHAVPLAPVVVEKLRAWREATAGRPHVFASVGKKGHVTVDGLDKAYRETLGLRGRHVPHGWRSAFSSIAHDALDLAGKPRFDQDVIEMSLDHLHANAVRMAYDRGERWEARRALAHWWAERLAEAVRGQAVKAVDSVRAVG